MFSCFRTSLLAGLAIAGAAGLLPSHGQTVLVPPYVQPGNGSSLGGSDVKVVAWWTDQKPGLFSVEYEAPNQPARNVEPHRITLDFGVPLPKPGATPPPPVSSNPLAQASGTVEELQAELVRSSGVALPEREQHYFSYQATLSDLPYDSVVHYRVKLEQRLIQEGSFKTRASASKAIRFVAVGDIADGKTQQNAVAWQIQQQQPDFMIALGDIVYPQGRVSQYLHHFWPTFNNVGTPGPRTGAPLFSSIPLYPVVGNHDTEVAKLPDYPDAWGAYYFFHVPLNGPGLGASNLPLGRDQAVAAHFREQVGEAWPAMNIYSWDDGPAHFLAFDSGGSVNPNDAKLQAWVEADLRNSRQRWKFVCFHSPGFHTSREHYTEQKMRFWQPIFERGGVDVLFSGHVHNYQRSKPFHFAPTTRDARGRVNGEMRLDEHFDGVKNTVPDGIIQIVSGGGGATLYSVDFAKTVEALQKEHGENYQQLTAKYVSEHSFSMVDLTPNEFTLRQIATDGRELDRITITKP